MQVFVGIRLLSRRHLQLKVIAAATLNATLVVFPHATVVSHTQTKTYCLNAFGIFFSREYVTSKRDVWFANE